MYIPLEVSLSVFSFLCLEGFKKNLQQESLQGQVAECMLFGYCSNFVI